MRKIGIELIFLDCSKDWIDPVDEDEFDSMITNSASDIVIKNGIGEYRYNKSDIADIIKYPLFECCGHDGRGWHGSRCEKNGD